MNAKRERRTLWWAIIASFFVHVIVALSLASFNNAFGPTPIEEDKPVELTVIDLSATPPPIRANPPFMQTEKESAEEPTEKTFESNANSIAASNLPASGDAPLPSQEGKEKPFVDLQTHDYSLPSKGSRPQPEAKPTPPPATPMPTARSTATPRPTPVATPEPIATPAPEQFAMLKATPPPPLHNPDEVEATPAPEVPPSAPPIISRPLPQRPASDYQQQKQETRISGRITNRGQSAVNAVGTPLGKYMKSVYDAIGSRWYYYMNDRMDLVSVGTAHVEAEVDAKGKIQKLRVLSNNSNEAFANICLQSFQEAQIPPIPPDLIATLPEGRLPVDISFTTYPSR
jgi:outer membrane biosynthesis protein TonB